MVYFNNPSSEFTWDLKYRYKDLKGDQGDKTINDTWKRVAWGLSRVEKTEEEKNYWEKQFYSVLNNCKVLPGGRILSNAGTDRLGTSLINCVVSDTIPDSIEGIFQKVKEAAMTLQTGAGIGYDFSTIRPKGAYVHKVQAEASGPISFIQVYDQMCKTIMSAGLRRGAQLGALRVDHPDIEDFITVKLRNTKIDQFKQICREYGLPEDTCEEMLGSVDGTKTGFIEDAKILTQFNISVAVTDEFMQAVKEDKDFDLKFDGKVFKTIKARELFNKITELTYNCNDPGVLYIDTVNKENNLWYCETIATTNPCVTGGTLVAVADGRGHVSFSQLEEEGKDVPVYCLNHNGAVTVRTMRHPRITGYNQQIYKVNLDDGSSLRVTGNHKFKLSSGEYKEAKDLAYGDSLWLMTRESAALEEVWKQSNSASQNYWWIKNKGKSTKLEHRLIAEFHYGDIPKYHVVHHIDHNAQNNSPNNLQIMSKEAHDKHHACDRLGSMNPMVRAQTEWSEEKWAEYKSNMSDSISGEKNGRYSGISNEKMKQHAIVLTKQLNRRFSTVEWKEYCEENNIPDFLYGKWRKDHLNGGVAGLAKWAALELGLDLDVVNLDLKSAKKYYKLLDLGYDCFIQDNMVYVNKNCEVCENPYVIPHGRYEQGYCSQSCGNKARTEEQNAEYLRKKMEAEEPKKQAKREFAAKVYSDLKFNLSRDPSRKEFQAKCKELGTSINMGSGNVIKNIEHVKELATTYNHKVVSVELDGFENVYNGTVDEFHNYFIGGFETATESQKPRYSYVCTKQCGEQTLPPHGNCLLTSINLTQYVNSPFEKDASINWDQLEKDIPVIVRMMDNVIETTFMSLDKQIEEMKAKRRIGLGITGLGDLFAMLKIRYGSKESVEIADKIMGFVNKNAYKASIGLAKERGAFPLFDAEKYTQSRFIQRHHQDLIEDIKKHGIRNSHLLSVQPTGTISQVANQVSSGLEPIFLREYERFIRLDDGQSKKRVQVVDYAWQLYKDKFNWKEGDKIPEYFADINQLNVDDHINIQIAIANHLDAACSKTINVPQEYPFEDFQKVYMKAWESGVVKGTTTYRFGTGASVLIDTSKKEEKPKANTTNNKKPFKRKAKNPSYSYKIKTPKGNFYPTIVEQDGDPIEVFINAGKQSQEIIDYCIALGRMCSLYLQDTKIEDKKAALQIIANNLRDINSEEICWVDGDVVKSVPDALSHVIEDYLDIKPLGKLKHDKTQGTKKTKKIKCKGCKNYIDFEPGCHNPPCPECGFEGKCGG